MTTPPPSAVELMGDALRQIAAVGRRRSVQRIGDMYDMRRRSVQRIGDMYDMQGGYQDIEEKSEEAQIAENALAQVAILAASPSSAQAGGDVPTIEDAALVVDRLLAEVSDNITCNVDEPITPSPEANLTLAHAALWLAKASVEIRALVAQSDVAEGQGHD